MPSALKPCLVWMSTVAVAVGAFAQLMLTPPANAAEPTVPESTHRIGMSFVRIPAGTFLMGAADSDREATAAEKPQHRVTITRPFLLASHEVTQAQWQAVMGGSAFASARSNPFYDLPGMAARLNHPANPATVSWNDAQAFIRRLNELEGHRRYRLPTEAEWEYAARAGTTTAYSFGDDKALLGRYAWFGEDFATGSTHPVGQKLPNPWKLYDVHGNVWEWVQDFYSERYDPAGAGEDPRGPATGTARTVRGGSWHITSGSWRSSFRKPYDADYRGISIGFRLAMDIAD